jgi:aldehyde:ferredoxin oxidoreductase
MQDLSNKKILYIDLKNQSYEVKNQPGLHKYIGGTGMGLKLLQQNIKEDPLIFAIGPLNGFFPFCSKTAVVLDDSGVTEDLYIGGRLSTRLRFTGVDALVITGESENPVTLAIDNNEVAFKTVDVDKNSLGLPGKRAVLERNNINVYLDDYFFTPEDILKDKFDKKKLASFVITGTEIFKPKRFDNYVSLYQQLLKRVDDMTITKGKNPSCSNCPMGCDRSKFGEMGGNVLLHSLVACQFAERIYSDVGVVFSCLNVLGYDYTHEDIEALPHLIETTLKELS